MLYNLLFAVAYLAMLPSFLLRMKRRGGYRARMGDRFGRYPEEVLRALARSPAPIWVHAVSVGEVQVAGQLMRALRAREPSVRFVFSTTSSTGWKTAEGELAKLAGDGADVLIYNPLDFNGCVARALERVRPRAVILTETEIWPNFIRAVRRRGVPLYLVNARVSDRSAPRYRALRWFFGEVFRCFAKVYAQSDLDAARLVAAGADAAKVAVTGSFKFDVAHRNPAKERELAAWVRRGADTLPPILLGGSTWPGEDEALLRVYAALVKRHPEVALVIAPRHFEKADAVEANIRRAGFDCIRRSRPGDAAPTRPPVFLCDTTGEMMGLFGISTVAFVGKSLCAHGSQNMIEPCLCGTPTVVGPHTENFRPVMSDLLAAEAVVQVPDEASLAREVLRLFDDPAARVALGARATAAVERRCGVVGRCADELLEALR
ncbi:MAG: 3-deoxy-D-manno-octulosonic acid transferase [Kiritimatiellia bacterium]